MDYPNSCPQTPAELVKSVARIFRTADFSVGDKPYEAADRLVTEYLVAVETLSPSQAATVVQTARDIYRCYASNNVNERVVLILQLVSFAREMFPSSVL